MQAANTKFGKRIVQFKVPFVAAAPCLRANHAGSEAPILGEKRVRRNLQGINAVRRNTQAKLPGGRIGDVDGVHNTLLVNSVNVTDPATGQFGLSIPANSGDSLKVSANPFLAQYGGFTSGVVSAETRRGGDKWNFELNDPFPEFRIRSLHLQGLRSVSPNVTFSGPILKNKLYFAEAGQYDLEKTPVRTLPFPVNETRTDARNSFTQLDFLPSIKHTMMSTFHMQTQDTRFAGLDFFNPQPVTPNFN